jgi:hypothetical protein
MEPATADDGSSDVAEGKSSSFGAPAGSIWELIGSDVAGFVVALHSMLEGRTAASCEALLDAADLLLRASARTRLEVEHVLRRRRLNARLGQENEGEISGSPLEARREVGTGADARSSPLGQLEV